jgi:mono/diheme cytochrome c family protein
MRRVDGFAIVVLVAAITGGTVGCGRDHRGPPNAPAMRPQTAEVARGQELFRKFCYQCHPHGAGGLGPVLNDKPLPQFAIRTQIRKGVGAMPAFGDDWLSDDEVAAIAEYVQALRDAP